MAKQTGLGDYLAVDDSGGTARDISNDVTSIQIQTPQALIDTLRGFNPWVETADFDHHGYGLVEVVGPDSRVAVTDSGVDCGSVRGQRPGDDFGGEVWPVTLQPGEDVGSVVLLG